MIKLRKFASNYFFGSVSELKQNKVWSSYPCLKFIILNHGKRWSHTKTENSNKLLGLLSDKRKNCMISVIESKLSCNNFNSDFQRQMHNLYESGNVK